jgi:RNA polymerase sigma factor (sigma-70 family)
MTVVAQTGTVAETRALIAARETAPFDVAVLDLGLPDGDGIDLIRPLLDRARIRSERVAVLVLTAAGDRLRIARAVEAGATAVLNKAAPIEQLLAGIRKLHAGEELLSPQETIELLRLAALRREEDSAAQRALAQLTPRERDVLRCLTDGLTDKEIADRLCVSSETIRTHMVNLLHKLGAESRLQALVFAIRHGAVDIR